MFQFRAFPTYAYFIQRTLTEYCSAGFPHSEILGSMCMCHSPRLIAACHVLRRLLMPRHSPCALYSLTYSRYFGSRSVWIMQAITDFLSRKIVIVTLFYYRSVPQLKIHNFLSDSSERPFCCLAFITFQYIVQFSRCKSPVSFETRCKRSIPETLSSILKRLPSSIVWWR